jgi:tRNA-(ms[2]io[6]A)-hydroxylase
MLYFWPGEYFKTLGSRISLDNRGQTGDRGDMFPLAVPTRSSWLPEVLSDLEALLVDHAHCEKKAASTAMALIYRYPERPEMMAPLSRLAREELHHFERVLDLIHSRGFEFKRMFPSPYAGELVKHIRKEDPHKLLDTLVVCALIEARSHERMVLLADGFAQNGDAILAEFYTTLLASEARHKQEYLDMAHRYFPDAVVQERVEVLAAAEAEVLRKPGPEPRMHS